VQAGIPDFRSPEGLFQTLKRDNPRESLASGKDLFDASVFNVSAYQLFKKLPGSCLRPYVSGVPPALFNANNFWETTHGLRVMLIYS
jgi:NAD-dependent SIR2 family protein deacetylase